MLGKCISLPLQLEDLEVIIPQGLAVPSQVQDVHGGSMSVAMSRHVAFCADTNRTWMWRAGLATGPKLPSIPAPDHCHRVMLSCTKLP